MVRVATPSLCFQYVPRQTGAFVTMVVVVMVVLVVARAAPFGDSVDNTPVFAATILGHVQNLAVEWHKRPYRDGCWPWLNPSCCRPHLAPRWQ